ncbi:MAG: DNA polymerase III subunit alpha [Patescibacteria group bacterium]
MPSRFVHLHVHSHYSLLEALPKVKALIKHAKEQEMDTFALTDNGVMYGAIEFYQKATDEGLKPIIGMDAYIAPFGRFEKRPKIDNKPYRLVLLAETNEGYKNLMKLSTIGFMEGFYYKPRIDKEVLKQFCVGQDHGIIALSGSQYGEIPTLIKNGEVEKAEVVIKEYAAMFGPDHFYLELVDRPELADVRAVNAVLIELGHKLGVPVVVTKDSYYLKPTDAEAWKIMACVKGGKTLEDYERMQPVEFDASLCSSEEIEKRFADVPEAIDNTRKIADRCNVTLELGKWNFANIDIPEGYTAQEWLGKRARTELVDKVPEVTEEMNTRIAYELSVIEQKGFAPYFLIVSDYIEWARKNGIVTTTRGSAAGSLVGFSIGISTVNPITYKLPFERFLNPERPSAPDVDGDFADNRREEVYNYVRDKYGADKVAQICTFGTMMARGSVRDVGRALGFPHSDCDRIAKMVPMGSQGFPMTLKRALEENPDLGKLYRQNSQVKRLIDLAMQIEGCGRHVSIHAAGVVISPLPLTEFTPLQIESREGRVLTQYEMKTVEAAGILKMDFLGIRNLSILGDAVALVNKLKGVDIVPEKIPVDDKKTFDLLAGGQTMGVFQLGGSGMTHFLMELKPTVITDIMAMVALYRPGPMESIPEYIKRKHNPELVSYLDPRMEKILDQSYGIITYQDDVMLLAIELAGYSWLEADKLRKAMGKKIPEEMAAQKEKLLKGFVEKGGLSKTFAQQLWKLIEPFAAYGFNKAHAASYGMIAYQTAYMKANYPAIYMTALMTAESADLEKIAEAVAECERMGIKVLPPDINESRLNFTYIDDVSIRFGLLAIKNLGADVIQTMVQERSANGPFQDLADFGKRIHHRAFNRKSIEALIKAGALDRFGERRELLENLDQILLYNRGARDQHDQNQGSLFDLAPSLVNEKLRLKPARPASVFEKLSWEKELLGLYVSAHPTEDVFKYAGDSIYRCAQALLAPDGTFVYLCVAVNAIKVILTKKQEQMAFVMVGDLSGSAEVIAFPRTFKDMKAMLVEGAVLLVSAKVSTKDGVTKFIASSFIPVTEHNAESLAGMIRQGMWIPESVADSLQSPLKPVAAPRPVTTFATAASPSFGGNPKMPMIEIQLRGKPSQDMISDLREVFAQHPGAGRVCLMVESAGSVRRIETEYTVRGDIDVLDALKGIVGKENVRVN